jgi:hypothetical protein
MLETIFGPTLTLSTSKVIPTRRVGEQHVKEDLVFIPSFADRMRAIRPLPWMGRSSRLKHRPAAEQAPVQLASNEEAARPVLTAGRLHPASRTE